MAQRLRSKMQQGSVVFDRDSGGAENSYTGDVTKMRDACGPLQEDLDSLISAVAQATVQRTPPAQ